MRFLVRGKKKKKAALLLLVRKFKIQRFPLVDCGGFYRLNNQLTGFVYV
jgi:hypothetical protein